MGGVTAATFKQSILAAAAGEVDQISVLLNESEVRSALRASIDLVGMLLAMISAGRGDTSTDAAIAEVRANLLLLELDQR